MAVGVTGRDFIELAKLAFIDAASTPKHTSVAKLVEKTGFSKHEVRRLREKLAAGDQRDNPIYPRPEGLVLERWFSDPRYLDDQGEPRTLPRGPGDGSLTELILDSVPAQDPKRIIDRLFHYDDVVEATPDAIRPLNRSAVAHEDAEGLEATLQMAFHPICLAIEHNMTETDANEKWLLRSAFAQRIPKEHLPYIRRRVRDRGGEFLLNVDEFMSSFVEGPPTGGDHDLVGLGLFYFEAKGQPADNDQAAADGNESP